MEDPFPSIHRKIQESRSSHRYSSPGLPCDYCQQSMRHLGCELQLVPREATAFRSAATLNIYAVTTASEFVTSSDLKYPDLTIHTIPNFLRIQNFRSGKWIKKNCAFACRIFRTRVDGG